MKNHDPDQFCPHCGAGESYQHEAECPESKKSIKEIYVVYRVRDGLPLIAFTDIARAWDDAAEQNQFNPTTSYSVHTVNLVDGKE